jgi:hypothetical protein
MNYLFLIWAFPSPVSQSRNTGSVAFVLHSVTVFCPPKKRTKELVFSEKKKPYASYLTRAKWQEKPKVLFIQFP